MMGSEVTLTANGFGRGSSGLERPDWQNFVVSKSQCAPALITIFRTVKRIAV